MRGRTWTGHIIVQQKPNVGSKQLRIRDIRRPLCLAVIDVDGDLMWAPRVSSGPRCGHVPNHNKSRRTAVHSADLAASRQ